ncbi:MAG: class I SAM-dependent methyltransferase [Chloroflexi bacterium]|nr:class I SAM-dependent methyltransferase [Chloroflexota bacterium]
MNTITKEINEHYTQSNLSEKILNSLQQAGKDVNALTRSDIIKFDEFHIRGSAATKELGQLADIQPGEKLLDLGCGIGGAARTLMTEFGANVTGIDLVDEYISTARALNEHIGYDGQITFEQADALDIPSLDNSFDVVFSQHITMNIENKAQLAQEVRRVLRPGGRFVLYEICAGAVDAPHLPVPWAGDQSINCLVEPEILRQIFEESGFQTTEWRDVTAMSLSWNQGLVTDMILPPIDGPILLGQNLLMGDTAFLKLKNMMMNMQEDRIRVIQGVMISEL